LEKLGINLGYLLVFALNFAIIFVVLRAWVYKPLLGMLEKRKKAIAQGLDDARVAADARANAEQEAKKIISESQLKAADILREANDRAELIAKDIRANAEIETAKARETALAEVEQERTAILSGLRGQVVTLAIAAAQRLIGESLIQDEKRQHALLEEFFSGVKSGNVLILKDVDVTGVSAEVTSALPLNDAEKDAIRKDLVKNLSGGASISFRVDPSILGGLIVRVGDRIVDGSVSGQLQNLRQKLQ